jgi:hypothetical protein
MYFFGNFPLMTRGLSMHSSKHFTEVSKGKKGGCELEVFLSQRLWIFFIRMGQNSPLAWGTYIYVLIDIF